MSSEELKEERGNEGETEVQDVSEVEEDDGMEESDSEFDDPEGYVDDIPEEGDGVGRVIRTVGNMTIISSITSSVTLIILFVTLSSSRSSEG